jgi:hypothetical protein
MRSWIRALLLLACACEGRPDVDGEPGECFIDAAPAVRVGRVNDDGFQEFDDGESLAPFASPQGGFGLLLDLETQGIGVEPDHAVTVDIVAELDAAGGERVALYHLADAPLMCDGTAPGRWGTLLLTLDQQRFVSPADFAQISERDVVLSVEIEDDAETLARGARTVHVQAPP